MRFEDYRVVMIDVATLSTRLQFIEEEVEPEPNPTPAIKEACYSLHEALKHACAGSSITPASVRQVSERTEKLLALLDVEPERDSYIGSLLDLAYGVSGNAHMNAAEALAEIVKEARRIASNWQKLRDANSDAAWEDFAFYKGNGRWANGASTELAALDAKSFASAHDACDAAERLVRERSWDPDYDSPDAARNAMLEAIALVRAKLKPRPAPRD
jgi:hypothetical protein